MKVSRSLIDLHPSVVEGFGALIWSAICLLDGMLPQSKPENPSGAQKLSLGFFADTLLAQIILRPYAPTRLEPEKHLLPRCGGCGQYYLLSAFSTAMASGVVLDANDGLGANVSWPFPLKIFVRRIVTSDYSRAGLRTKEHWRKRGGGAGGTGRTTLVAQPR